MKSKFFLYFTALFTLFFACKSDLMDFEPEHLSPPDIQALQDQLSGPEADFFDRDFMSAGHSDLQRDPQDLVMA